MSRQGLAVVLGVLTMFMLACAGGGGANESVYSDPPPGSSLAKVELGMNEHDVRRLLGEPSDANAYQTGKAWIPYYYGPDTTRSDWMYGGIGRVVFSRNRYSGGLKVIRVMYNANEP